MKTLLTNFLILLSFGVFAQMSGSYTIDKTSAPSSSNFTSFIAAIDSLESQGLSGDVTINVVKGSGPYVEQVTIPRLLGSNLYNLTIDGNGEELSMSDSSDLGSYIIALDNAKNITIQNLEVKLKKYSVTRIGILVKNKCNNISIENCSVTCPISSNHNKFFTIGILVSNGAYIYDAGSTLSSFYNSVLFTTSKSGSSTEITIKNNRISNPVFGIVMDYSQGHLGTNIIEQNTITNFVYSGIVCCNGNDIIRANDISRRNGYLHHLENEEISAITGTGSNISGTLQIINNNIHSYANPPNDLLATWNRYGIKVGTTGNVTLTSIDHPLITGSNVQIFGNNIDIKNQSHFSMIGTWNEGMTEIVDNRLYFESSEDQLDAIVAINSSTFNSKGALSIRKNRISMNVSGKMDDFSGNLCGVRVSTLDSISISNNIFSISLTDINHFKTPPVGSSIDVIYLENLISSNINYNTIAILENQDSILYSSAFSLGNGSHSINNNIVSFSNLQSDGVFIYLDSTKNKKPTYNATNNAIDMNNNLGFTFSSSNTKISDLSVFNTRSSGTNYVENPNFINASKGDFRPQNLSVLNNAKPLTSITSDYHGSLRSVTTPDIGAIELTGNNPVSINDIAIEELTIYPNPSKGEFTINNFKVGSKAIVLSISGKIVKQSSSNVIDITGNKPGIYVVKVINNKKVSTKKVILF